MSPLLIVCGMVLPWLLVVLGVWLVFQLIRQNGRILLQLEKLQEQVQAALPAPEPGPPPGLPAGSPAPEFELPDLEGTPHRLEEFRGKRVLLVFFNPGCGFCQQMAPDLAELPLDGSPVPVVITAGDDDSIRRLVEEHQLRCPVLLQKESDVASKYQASGTPTGYLINEHGKLASALAVGADALLQLTVSPPEVNGQAANGTVEGAEHGARGKANRGLQASRIKRDGLEAGSPAPAFRLPRLGGGELALEDYRGRRVLLVFSDPECGPCEEVATRLEQLQRRRPDLAIVMISRRDPEVNRQKIGRLGLTFPVVLQKQWEISRKYAMFQTPIAYLIDEQGVVAAPVAVGVEPIVALASAGGSPAPETGKGAAS